MKRKITAILLSGALVGSLSVMVNAEESTITFRGYDWGTSKEEIMKNEITSDMVADVDYLEEDDGLLINGQSVAGLDALVLYNFTDNGLDSGVYSITEKHTNKTDYYRDYEDLVKKYTDKYGTPVIDQAQWKDDLYKDDPDDWGMAVAVGDVTFVSKWEKADGSTTGIMLKGDNYEINLAIIYQSPDYEYKENTDGI
ncbi:MAG: hypothetical protein MR675_12405 [Lachnospira sp.]|nr:hypothetical protein [Lachnospira sp.]